MTPVIVRQYRSGDEYFLDSWRMPEVGTPAWHIFQSNLGFNSNWTFTICTEPGKLVAIIGLIFHCAGNAEAWSMINDDALTMPAVPKAVRDTLHAYQEEHQIPRIWAGADPEEFDMLSRWFKFLGMHYEGLIQKWGPNGKDMHFFARFLEGGD